MNTLWSTSDGASWTQSPLSSDVFLRGLSVVGNGVWVCGDDGRFYYNAHGRPEYLPSRDAYRRPEWVASRQVIDLNMFAFDDDRVDETLYRLDGTDSVLPKPRGSQDAFRFGRLVGPFLRAPAKQQAGPAPRSSTSRWT